MRPGETVESSIQRLLERELHFIVKDPSRIRSIAHYTYCFDKRNEEPRENGNADMVAVLTIAVSQEEADSLTYH